MLSFATQKKGLDFRDSVDLKFKGQLIGDAGRLRQVITNLLTNAIKFTARGYISLEVLELQETPETLAVRFDVRDTGCGISPDTLARLFLPFSQADPSTARRFGGTGLGLSISKNLVELMNGQIGLDSVEGQGSHAWFIIPFTKAAKTGQWQASGASLADSAVVGGGMPNTESTTLARPRKDIWILVAEDNIVNAQIASKNLKRMGFSCRTAENGLIALDELHKHPYDAVLMDCQMPECDGYEATRRIRKSLNPDIRILPVIALTASAIKGDRERALDAGMVDYLAKPVKRPALEATLCKWLFDQDARQSLGKFFAAPTATPLNAPAHYGARAWSTPPLASHSSVGTSTATAKEYPFPQQGNAEGISPGAVIQTSDSVQQLQLGVTPPPASSSDSGVPDPSASISSPSSETQKLSLPGPSGLGTAIAWPPSQESMSKLQRSTNSDALGAAAALLATRRSSAEEIARNIRPSINPRSKSHGHHVHYTDDTKGVLSSAEGSSSSTATMSSLQSVGAASGEAGGPPPIMRRSSREQGGMGRDLDGELLNATLSEPSLHAALADDTEESRAEQAVDAETQAGKDEDVVLSPPS